MAKPLQNGALNSSDVETGGEGSSATSKCSYSASPENNLTYNVVVSNLTYKVSILSYHTVLSFHLSVHHGLQKSCPDRMRNWILVVRLYWSWGCPNYFFRLKRRLKRKWKKRYCSTMWQRAPITAKFSLLQGHRARPKPRFWMHWLGGLNERASRATFSLMGNLWVRLSSESLVTSCRWTSL